MNGNLQFWALSKEEQNKIHNLRLKTKYHYKKCDFTLDETYYYNIYLENL